MEPAPCEVADDYHSSGLALAPCPATLSTGNLVVLPWGYQKAARASRRLIAPLPRLKFRVTVAVLSPAPPLLHPVKKPRCARVGEGCTFLPWRGSHAKWTEAADLGSSLSFSVLS